MYLNPYLNFDGDCAEAFSFYAECLGGKVTFLQTLGESPMAEHTPPEQRGRVLHAQLEVGSMVLMGSDSPAGHHTPAQGLYIMLGVDSPAEAERIYGALAAGGRVEMPLQETFWARRYGIVADRFGTPWMVNCDLPTQSS